MREGANAYLKGQYKGYRYLFAVMFCNFTCYGFQQFIRLLYTVCVLTGGFLSGLSGFIGMRTATIANCRTAEGASHSLNRGLKVAFSAGSVMGFTVCRPRTSGYHNLVYNPECCVWLTAGGRRIAR